MSTLKTCTSTTRPSPTDPALGNRPTTGDMLFETDTKRIIMFDGTEWYVYDYNITTAPIYTVTIEDSLGGSEAISSDGPFSGGDVVTLSHAEETGYDFSSWTVTNERTGGTVDVVDNSFIMPYSNVTVAANYVVVPTYNITVNGGSNGETLSTVPTAEAGDVVTISTTPDSGFVLSNITISDASLNAVQYIDNGNGTYTFSVPEANVTVATFFVPTYAITISETESGTTTSDLNVAKSGDSVTITTTPNDEFVLESIVVTDANSATVATVNNLDGTYTFTMPGAAVSVATTYIVKTYAINIADDTNGTTSSGVAVAALGDGVVITTAPDAGCTLHSIVITDADSNVINSTDNQNGTHSFTMPGSDVSVTATYSLIEYDIVVNGGDNGSTTSGVQTSTKDETITITATANEGYSLESIVVIDSASNTISTTDAGGGTFTFVMPSSNVTVTTTYS